MSRSRPPARTPQEREDQLISQAYDLAEKKIRDGTASSQVITQFLLLSILKSQNKLIEAKTENLEAQKKLEELYSNAVAAMRHYNGDDRDDESD